MIVVVVIVVVIAMMVVVITTPPASAAASPFRGPTYTLKPKQTHSHYRNTSTTYHPPLRCRKPRTNIKLLEKKKTRREKRKGRHHLTHRQERLGIGISECRMDSGLSTTLYPFFYIHVDKRNGEMAGLDGVECRGTVN
ncbi:hypothetical protein M0804_006546 [Polistes exclamans]|nr:hypothetical protein M0804_006546 [Polistes exclamans]